MGLVLTGAQSIGSSNSHAAEDGSLLKPTDPKIISLGEQIYADNCAACHGVDLEGQDNWRQRNTDGSLRAPPHDKTGHTWHHTDDILFGLTKLGAAQLMGIEGFKTSMPIYEDTLSDSEIIAVLSFIKSRWPEEIRARHDQMNASHAKANK